MNYPSAEEVKKQTNDICHLILDNIKDIEFRCNDGAIVVNPVDLNFTYIGEWGDMVLMSEINKCIGTRQELKIINLATWILIYSMNYGGFNIITIN